MLEPWKEDEGVALIIILGMALNLILVPPVRLRPIPVREGSWIHALRQTAHGADRPMSRGCLHTRQSRTD